MFPWIWLWQLYGGAPDYPWWGAEYALAVEPVTSHALRFSDAVENGTALKIPGGAAIGTSLSAWAFEGDGPVARITAQGVERPDG